VAWKVWIKKGVRTGRLRTNTGLAPFDYIGKNNGKKDEGASKNETPKEDFSFDSDFNAGVDGLRTTG
jgi:hypothetical protein